jgi:hypothetical protein
VEGAAEPPPQPLIAPALRAVAATAVRIPSFALLVMW